MALGAGQMPGKGQPVLPRPTRASSPGADYGTTLWNAVENDDPLSIARTRAASATPF